MSALRLIVGILMFVYAGSQLFSYGVMRTSGLVTKQSKFIMAACLGITVLAGLLLIAASS